ncbi:MAG: hypothetical protein Q9195_005562 [Heterodermia aff. obscurata]
MSDADGSEDVNDFLQRIRELGNQRDKEDEERTRKLEEEILQGRKERQARRAGQCNVNRARSLSPTKDSTSNAGTPHSMRSTTDASLQDLSNSPATTYTSPSPDKQRVSKDSMAEKNMSETASQGENTSGEKVGDAPVSISSQRPSDSPNSVVPLSRSGTLSWQQRPSSRGTITGRNRPLSMVATENLAARSPRTSAEPTAINDEASSRSEIAQSLGAKDPAFFRQTEDRGLESAAYRKTPADNVVDIASAGGIRRLPGLAKDPPVQQEKPSLKPVENSPWLPPSRESSVRGGSGSSQNLTTSASTSSLRSPLPTMDSQRLEPPASDTSSSFGAESTSSSRGLAMSPSQGRMTVDRTERPSSPTKGLGGFVQSAMLKRSDSVNKRWSAQIGPNLSRGNSIASNRSGYDGSRSTMGGIAPPQDFRPNSASRETSPVPTLRPVSAQGDLAISELAGPNKSTATTRFKSATNSFTLSDDPVPKAAPLITDPPSHLDVERNEGGEEDAHRGAPASPTKRWSPSKSSWLENAINKPDSPKPKAAPPQQPPWMADLNKAKQQRGSVDLGKGTSFKEISTGGLMRSPPPGGLNKAPAISGLPSSFTAGLSGKPRIQTPPVSEPVKSPVGEAIHDTKSSPLPEIEISKGENPSQIDKGALLDQAPIAMIETPLSTSSPAKTSADSKSFTSTKPKPETPPKKDFTSSLKPRKSLADKALKDEPEFKNVFGKLKKTQTQSYVAPDELKDNIMRGKAGLASTNGPQKSERRDDFKDSILQKREAMKAGLPSASTTITNSFKSRDTALPEALVKRQGLARSNSSINDTEPSVVKQSSLTQHGSSLTAGGRTTSTDSQKQTAASAKLGETFNASLAGILSRGPLPMKDDSSSSLVKTPMADNDDTSRDTETQASSLTSQLNHITKGRAKGPKRRLPTAVDQDATTTRPSSSSAPDSANKIIIDKSSGNKILKYDQSVTPAPSVAASRPLSNISNNNRKVSQPTSPRKPSTSITMTSEVKTQSPAAQATPPESTITATKPSQMVKQTPALDVNVKKPRKPSVSRSKPFREESVRTADLPKGPQDDSIEKIRGSEQTEGVTPSASVKGAAALWQQPTLVQRNGARSPIKLPTRKDEEAAHEQAGLRNPSSSSLIGLGIETATNKPQTPTPFARSLPTPPALSPRSPKSPPLPGKKPASISNRIPSNTPSKSPLPQTNSSPTSQAAHTISDFFGTTSKSVVKFNIDTQSIISSCSSYQGPEKIKTLRKQIFELGGDGKLLPVPSQQEHILFEENLYLCTHVFGGMSGTRTTEVYLWAGDCVPASAVEDAQIFARKFAKENNGKLVQFKQGKESSNFFQALGGIVITRRGSSTRQHSSSNSSSPYMLCARRHVGQIAFDEVDFSAVSLCKGFPYIISTLSGKLFLWKGSGSGADELGCARLIGMDLGITGEIEEVDEGQEPPSFWQAFPSGNQSAVAGAHYWHLKSGYEKYTTRLFDVEAEAPRPKSSSSYLPWGRRGSAPASEDDGNMIAAIKELMPFAQADLASEGVYVLDTFFEIFVIVTAKEGSLLPSFRAALTFAQEYGILVASAEDRPFVPAGSVVLGRDAPESCKRAFRKWEDRRGPCIVLPINDALLATRG